MSSAKPLLFSCWMSSCAWRVRIALHLKEIDFDIKTISENLIFHMKLINFLEDGQTLIESLAIISFLEERHPQPSLLPNDIFQRSKARAISDVICSGIQPLQNLKVQKFSRGDDTLNFQWANYWISKGFDSLEKILKQSAGEYCVGNDISVADCCLVPQVANAKRYKVDVSSFPIICGIDNKLKAHKAFTLAHPSKQPDFPKELPAQFASQFQ